MLIKKTDASDLRTSSIQGIHQDTIIALIMKAVCTSEKSVYFYDTTRRHIPESCNLHTYQSCIKCLSIETNCQMNSFFGRWTRSEMVVMFHVKAMKNYVENERNGEREEG
jgi:hypothetical protein